MRGHHGYQDGNVSALGTPALSSARPLDAPAIRVIPGGCFAQPARLHLCTLAFLPAVPSRTDRCSVAGTPSAHESAADGTLRRPGNRPRHSLGGGESAPEEPYRRRALSGSVLGQRHLGEQRPPWTLPLQPHGVDDGAGLLCPRP